MGYGLCDLWAGNCWLLAYTCLAGIICEIPILSSFPCMEELHRHRLATYSGKAAGALISCRISHPGPEFLDPYSITPTGGLAFDLSWTMDRVSARNPSPFISLGLAYDRRRKEAGNAAVRRSCACLSFPKPCVHSLLDAHHHHPIRGATSTSPPSLLVGYYCPNYS